MRRKQVPSLAEPVVTHGCIDGVHGRAVPPSGTQESGPRLGGECIRHRNHGETHRHALEAAAHVRREQPESIPHAVLFHVVLDHGQMAAMQRVNASPNRGRRQPGKEHQFAVSGPEVAFRRHFNAERRAPRAEHVRRTGKVRERFARRIHHVRIQHAVEAAGHRRNSRGRQQAGDREKSNCTSQSWERHGCAPYARLETIHRLQFNRFPSATVMRH